MKMTELSFGGEQPPIDGYAPGGFRIGGVFYEGALIASAAGVVGWNAPGSAAALTEAHAVALIEVLNQVDVLLIGLGAEAVAAPQAFRAALEAASTGGGGVDFMTSPSVCRTYNVLLSEGRRAAVALLPL